VVIQLRLVPRRVPRDGRVSRETERRRRDVIDVLLDNDLE